MLKKFLPIALVVLVLLNTMGYYLVFMAVEYKNDVHMIRQFDASTDNLNSSITVKIPIAIPYLADDTEYVRVDGKYEFKGEYYRMVKQKYAEDTLFIICVKDQVNKRIHSAMSDYVKGFAAKPATPHANFKLVFSFNKDYVQHHPVVKTSTYGWAVDVEKKVYCDNLIATYSSTIIHPPERS